MLENIKFILEESSSSEYFTPRTKDLEFSPNRPYPKMVVVN